MMYGFNLALRRLLMRRSRPIRIIMAKAGLDGHDRGVKVVSALLREAGMEVIYLGPYQMPDTIIQAAMEEDADVIGLSSLSGEHLTFVPKVLKLLSEKHLEDVVLLVGGVIPAEDIPVLKEMGVAEVFITGSSTKAIIDFINNNIL
jgi:methylmalonyl-CoA mutase C-terminal domain/subunit